MLSVVQYGRDTCSEVVDETVVVKLCCGVLQLNSSLVQRKHTANGSAQCCGFVQ